MVKNMRCQIVIILISALIGAAISAFFVAKESDKYIEHRLNADKVKLQIESDIDGLEYLVSSNYSKRELNRQISSSYYHRYMLSNGKQLPSTIKIIDEDDYPKKWTKKDR